MIKHLKGVARVDFILVPRIVAKEEIALRVGLQKLEKRSVNLDNGPNGCLISGSKSIDTT